jgi:hypothetical protein
LHHDFVPRIESPCQFGIGDARDREPPKRCIQNSKSAKTAAFTVADGIAMSNDGPLLGTAAKLPLNKLVGLTLNQPFVLEIDRAGVADELEQMFDVVLYLEYTANF